MNAVHLHAALILLLLQRNEHLDCRDHSVLALVHV